MHFYQAIIMGGRVTNKNLPAFYFSNLPGGEDQCMV